MQWLANGRHECKHGKATVYTYQEGRKSTATVVDHGLTHLIVRDLKYPTPPALVFAFHRLTAISTHERAVCGDGF
jgi:hypothetical protein